MWADMTCLCFVLNIKFNSMDGENTLYDHLLNQNCSQNSANKIPKFPNFSNFSDFPHTTKKNSECRTWTRKCQLYFKFAKLVSQIIFLLCGKKTTKFKKLPTISSKLVSQIIFLLCRKKTKFNILLLVQN